MSLFEGREVQHGLCQRPGFDLRFPVDVKVRGDSALTNDILPATPSASLLYLTPTIIEAL